MKKTEVMAVPIIGCTITTILLVTKQCPCFVWEQAISQNCGMAGLKLAGELHCVVHGFTGRSLLIIYIYIANLVEASYFAVV